MLSVAQIPCSDGKTRTCIVRLEPVNDGAMYEFHDPLTNEIVGCVGRHRLDEFVTPLLDWCSK